MSVETDGVEEAFEGQLRVLLTAAGQVGERLARAREEALRRAQAGSERDAREVRSRYDAQRRTARAELGNVYRPGWWDQASPEQIATAHEVARAWAQDDPEAVRAEQQLRQEVRSRYGVDLDHSGADPTAVREAVDRAVLRREQPDGARQRVEVQQGGQVEQGETALLMAQGDAADRAAERSRTLGAASGEEVGRVEVSSTAVQSHRALDADDRHAADELLVQINDRYGVDLASAFREAGQPVGHEPNRTAIGLVSASAQAVQSYQGLDPDDRQSADRLLEQINDRYGVNLTPALSETPDRLIAQGQSKEQRQVTTGQINELRPGHDSVERRTAMAGDLEAAGVDPETAARRLRADVSQARPAREATAAAVGTTVKGRKTPGSSPEARRTTPAR